MDMVGRKVKYHNGVMWEWGVITRAGEKCAFVRFSGDFGSKGVEWEELYERDISDINDHRIALDREVFEKLTLDEADHHRALIAKHAPMGNDPWHEEDGDNMAMMET